MQIFLKVKNNIFQTRIVAVELFHLFKNKWLFEKFWDFTFQYMPLCFSWSYMLLQVNTCSIYQYKLGQRGFMAAML